MSVTETDLGKRTKAKTSDNNDLTSCFVQRFQCKQNKNSGKGPGQEPGKVVNLRPNFSGSNGYLFVSPCPPECNFRSETKIEPDLRLGGGELGSLVVPMILAIVTSRTENRATSRSFRKWRRCHFQMLLLK